MTLASDEQKCVKVNEEDKPPDTTERLQNGSCVQVEVIQNPPEGIQHLPKGIQHPPEGIQHPPKGIQHPPKGIEHPPEGIQHPPEATSPSTKLTKPRELSNPCELCGYGHLWHILAFPCKQIIYRQGLDS